MTMLFMDSTDFASCGIWRPQISGPFAKWGVRGAYTGSNFELNPTLWGGGSHCLRPLSDAATAGFTINNPLVADPITAGFRIRFPSSLPPGYPRIPFFEYLTTSFDPNGPCMFMTDDGRLGACPGWQNTTTWVQSSPGAFTMGSTHYVEYKTVMSYLPTGSVEIKVDGTVVCSATSVQSLLYPVPAAAITMNRLYFFGLTSPYDYLVRDVYVCDSAGPRNNTYLGDTPMGVMLPRADGFYHDWAPNGLHYPLMADQQPDLSGIIRANFLPIGSRDSYIFNPPANTGGRIAGVSIVVGMPNPYANGPHIRPFFRIGGANYAATDRLIPTYPGLNAVIWYGSEPVNNASVQLQIFETNPATGTDWTYSDLAALEAGVQTVESSDYGCTQVLIETTLPGSSYTPPSSQGGDYAAIIGTGDTGVQGLSPAGLTEGTNNVVSLASGDAGPPATSATVQEDT